MFTVLPHAARLGRRLAALALLGPAALAAQQPAAAPPAVPLSLQDALALARQNNPDYQAQRNDLDVARWQVRQANADFIPGASASTSFGYTASGERRFGSVGFGEQPSSYSSSYDLGLSLSVSGSKLLQPRLARAQQRATVQRVEGADATLTAQVTQQYLSVLQAQETVAQAERDLARTGEYVRLAQARFDVGAGTPLDVRRAEVQQGQAEVRLVQAQSTLATSLLTLGQLLGTPLSDSTTLSSQFRLFEPTWNAAELTERALRNNPLLVAARATSEAARTGVQAARSTYLPTLSFSAGWRGYAQRYGELDGLVSSQLRNMQPNYLGCLQQNEIRTRVGLATSPCTNPADPAVAAEIRNGLEDQNSAYPFDYTRQPLSASMTVSLPIFTGLQRELQVQRARADAEDARYQVRAQELRLQADVAAAVRNLQTAYRTAQLQEKVRATAAEELRLAQERFRYGAANSIEVTDAQTNLAEAERAQIDAVYNFHKSLAALEALLGEPLR